MSICRSNRSHPSGRSSISSGFCFFGVFAMENCQFEIRGGSYQFWAFGGPIDSPSDHPEVFEAIGHAIASWARMEHMIDALLMHLNKEAFSAEVYESDYPRNFKKKANLLKDWFKKHPELGDLTESVLAVLPKIKSVAQVRHFIAHASIERYDDETGEIWFNSIRFQGDDNFECKKETLRIEGVRTVGELANRANLFLVAIAQEVFVPDASERFQKP